MNTGASRSARIRRPGEPADETLGRRWRSLRGLFGLWVRLPADRTASVRAAIGPVFVLEPWSDWVAADKWPSRRERGVQTFVYGTLADRAGASAVLDEFAFAGPAVLVGCHRVEGRYPTLAPGGRVEGRILVTDEVATLDAYEGVDRELYVRVPVPTAADLDAAVGGNPVQVYVGDPDRLDADASWPGDGTFPERVRRFVETRNVVVRPRGTDGQA